MRRSADFLTRHRNLFLILLLITTLIISTAVHRREIEAASASVTIPVTEVPALSGSALEAYRLQRDQEMRNSISSLEQLCTQELVDQRTRDDAAARLQSLISCVQVQTALEGALLNSSLSPCVAVVTGSNVTIVTEKETITEKDSALVMTLAAVHAAASPDSIRIITAEK